MKLIVDVNIEDKKWLKITSSVVIKRLIKLVLKLQKDKIFADEVEVSVLLTNDKNITKLNKQYRNKNKPTNVLSFPCDDIFQKKQFINLGDIILSLDTISLEAKEQNKKIEHHLAHMVIHGMLHLLGYDHIRVKDAHKMEALEIEILHGLNIANPY